MENINKNTDIIKKKEIKLFFKFSIPNILSLVIMSSAGIFDAAFIGRYVGENSLAGVNIANPVFSIIWGLTMMIITGSAVTVGNYLGQKNINKANIVFTKSILAVVLVSAIIIILIYLFKNPIIYLIGGSPITAPIAVTYLSYILPFLFFITVGYALSVFARVDNFPFLSSLSLIIGAVANVILDAIFIIIFNWGVIGAAIATGISYFISFVILLVHFGLKRGVLRLNFSKSSWSEIFRASYNGLSEFVNESSVGFIIILFNVLMMKYAQESGVAAFTAINYVMWVGIMVAYAVADALNPLISINYGANEIKRIKKFLKIGIIFVTTNGFLVFLTLSFFPEFLTSLFINNTESKAYPIAIEFMGFIKWVFLINGSNMILSAYFTATLRPVESAIIATLRSLIMPSILLFTLPKFLETLGVYIAVPLGEVITIIVALLLFFLTKRKLLDSKMQPS